MQDIIAVQIRVQAVENRRFFVQLSNICILSQCLQNAGKSGLLHVLNYNYLAFTPGKNSLLPVRFTIHVFFLPPHSCTIHTGATLPFYLLNRRASFVIIFFAFCGLCLAFVHDSNVSYIFEQNLNFVYFDTYYLDIYRTYQKSAPMKTLEKYLST